MISNVSISQYYPADSWLHSLDPRVKLVSSILFITFMFMIQSYIGYGFVLLCLLMLIRMSKVPLRIILRGMRGIVIIVTFTVFLNIFMSPGNTELFNFYGIRVTLEGLITASKMAVRIVFLIIGSTLLTILTTSPIQLTDAIESLLKPFKKIGVPAHEIAMMMTIALRFIPTLLEETNKIMKAQMARGADFDTGGIIKKAKSLIPLLIPLFVSSFRRADELAIAMEARCYRGGTNRTRMKQMRLMAQDFIAMSIMAGFIGIIVLFKIIGL